eukprot:CAMPEP_0204313298 /NCGR_PEP_ID=MMETSP0469-20131031/3506_1 /ASSEMBLY_ACC=CAM_ASM_000384 /TAXON_ID=2969 /ORGANISM="Oxyrrhis marina" /LENGTH=44 /DNA_ID= /DNA_START= /DNA_END= /DNA_ORIENTATION=
MVTRLLRQHPWHHVGWRGRRGRDQGAGGVAAGVEIRVPAAWPQG